MALRDEQSILLLMRLLNRRLQGILLLMALHEEQPEASYQAYSSCASVMKSTFQPVTSAPFCATDIIHTGKFRYRVAVGAPVQ